MGAFDDLKSGLQGGGNQAPAGGFAALKQNLGQSAPSAGGTQTTAGDGEISQGVSPWKHKVSGIARESLRGLGLGLGGLAGGAAGAVEGLGTPASIALGAAQGVAGAGLGYAMGNKAADIIDNSVLGIGKPAPLKTQLVNSAKDVGTGAMAEMGGQVAGPIIGKGLGLAAKGLRGPTTRAQVQAGEMLSKAYKPTSESAGNVAKYEDLQNRMSLKLPMTRAQQMGTKEAGMFEQGLATSSEIAGPLSRQDTDTRQTSLESVMKALGPGKSAPERAMEQPAGRNVSQRIQAAYEPVKQAETEAYAAIPKYEMPTANLDSQISELKKQPMAEKARAEFDAAVAYLSGGKSGHQTLPGVGKDTLSMREASKSLGNDIRKFQKAGDENTARPLRMLKSAIDGDLSALGEAAKNGSIMVHEGRIVYPQKLQSELTDLEGRIAEEQAKQIPDIQKMQEAFNASGRPYMKMNGESPKTFEARLSADYQKAFPGQEVPLSQGSKSLEDLMGRKSKIEAALQNAQPAEDAAAAINNAVGLSRQKFKRFKEGAVGDVRKPGDEINGLRLPDEQIRKQFGTVSGYNSLVRAVGEDDAKDLMRSHFTNEMRGAGEHFDVKKALGYYRKNLEVLKKSGLDAEARETIKGEIPNEFKRMLETKRLEPGTTDQPYFTAQESRKILGDYGGTLRMLYGNKPVQSLRDYHEVLTMLDRNKNQGYSGNSLSAEKILNNPEWFLDEKERIPHPLRRVAGIFLDVLAASGGAAAGAAVHGVPGAAIGSAGGFAVRRGYAEVKRDTANRVLQYLREAVVDPSKAEVLIKVMRAKNDRTAAKIAGEGIAKMGATGAAMILGPDRNDKTDRRSRRDAAKEMR